MLEAEFDQFALDYHDEHASSIRLSGEQPEYFARYKIEDVAREMARLGHTPRRILDFGGGIGNSVPHMRAAFPDSEIVVLDLSAECLQLAASRYPGQALFTQFDGAHIPFEPSYFDLAFAACVFHHIPHEEHVAAIREINRVLAPGGSFFIFEHNPLNPLTRRAVANCAFDENAVLLHAGQARRTLADGGLRDASIAYRIFFPAMLAKLRRLERFLVGLPLGAQYFVHAVKPAV